MNPLDPEKYINNLPDNEHVVVALTGIIAQIDDLKTENEKLKERSDRDSQTGLLTKTAFVDRFKTILEKSNNTGDPIALAFLDIDKFKDVNDTLGHQIGDQVITSFANKLKNGLRANDIVVGSGRLGGDEFGVFGLLEQRDNQKPLSNLEKIKGFKDNLESICAEFLDENSTIKKKIPLFDISIGFAFTGQGDDANDVKRLMHKADSEMYEHKKSKSKL